MASLLAITLPVFLLIGLGFAAGRSGAFGAEHARALGRFVLHVALPALVFEALASRRVEEIAQPGFLAAYGLASLAAFAAGFAWFRLALRVDVPRSAIRALGMSFSNSGFVGLPILLQLFGPAGAVPVALAMLVENMLMFPLGLALARAGSGEAGGAGRTARAVLLDLARTPILLAIVAGAAFSLLAIPLPGMIARTAGLVAAASAPVALFATGLGLVGVRLRGRMGTIGVIAAGKLLAHPLLVLLAIQLVPIADPELRAAALLLAAMPMFSVFPVLADRQGDGEACGAALLLATACSFASVSALLGTMGAGTG